MKNLPDLTREEIITTLEIGYEMTELYKQEIREMYLEKDKSEREIADEIVYRNFPIGLFEEEKEGIMELFELAVHNSLVGNSRYDLMMTYKGVVSDAEYVEKGLEKFYSED